jgi:hypothetical protein
MEPNDETFDQHHTYNDENKKVLPSLVNRIVEESSTPEGHRRDIDKMQTVFLSEDLLHPLSNDHVDKDAMPKRFDSRIKARFTWFGALCLAGVGMFVEAFVIITTGQVKTIWTSQYPTCWAPKKKQVCPQNIACCGLFPSTPNATCAANYTAPSTQAHFCGANGKFSADYICDANVPKAVSYSEFAGIMLGMVAFGLIADFIGRQKAGILTSFFMVTGISFMVFMKVDNYNSLFVLFTVFYGVFGFGVGGEYPLTATLAAEHHAEAYEDAMHDPDRLKKLVLRDAAKTARRGETIAIVFAMQGLGAVVGSLILLFLIYFSGQSRVDCNRAGANSTGNNADALNGIWRGFYFIGLIFVIMLLMYRTLVVKEGAGYEKLVQRKQRRAERLGGKVPGKLAILWFYLPRLIGTGGSWLVWDIAFYGLVRARSLSSVLLL